MVDFLKGGVLISILEIGKISMRIRNPPVKGVLEVVLLEGEQAVEEENEWLETSTRKKNIQSYKVETLTEIEEIGIPDHREVCVFTFFYYSLVTNHPCLF